MMHFKARQQFVVFTGKQKYFVKPREEVKFFLKQLYIYIYGTPQSKQYRATEK